MEDEKSGLRNFIKFEKEKGKSLKGCNWKATHAQNNGEGEKIVDNNGYWRPRICDLYNACWSRAVIICEYKDEMITFHYAPSEN